MKAKNKKELLRKLRDIENDLSPENLCCDGEASMSWVMFRGDALQTEKANILKQLGYAPTEEELYPEISRKQLTSQTK